MNKEKIYTDIAILGAGASGLMACCAIAKSGFKGNILLIENHPRVGKKLSVTGNGRCNLSNNDLGDNCYFGSAKKEALRLFKKFDCNFIKEHFLKLGLLTKDETGLVYPFSNSANSVIDVLRLQLDFGKIDLLSPCTVTQIKKEKSAYCLTSDNHMITCKKLIMACGGKSAAKLSTDGSGYKLAKSLGYNVASLFPSLAPVKVESPVLRSLKGIRQKCSVTLAVKNKIVRTEIGEVQFTENALSGICIFQLSRFVNEFFTKGTVEGKRCSDINILLDLFPTYDIHEVESIIFANAKCMDLHKIDELFTGVLVKRVGMAVLKSSGIGDFNRNIDTLTSTELKTICRTLKNWCFKPKSISDFNNSQVTAGGITCDEINFNTMQSKKDPNLFFAGELIDLDGLCGGYNLHWAWVSGIIAGNAAANNTVKEQ